MTFVWSVILTCCALAQAADDSNALLQVHGINARSTTDGLGPTTAITEVLTPLISANFAKLNYWMKHTDFKEKFMNATEELGEQQANSSWPEMPGFGALHDFTETVRISKLGFRMVIDAMQESLEDQNRMARETRDAAEAYHRVVGPKNFSIKAATEQQLDEAKPALLECLRVFEHDWLRGIELGRQNAAKVQEFYLTGEGADTPNMNSGITDMMAPERVTMGTRTYTEGIDIAKTALAPEAKTVEEKRKQLVEAREALLKLQSDVDKDQNRTLDGKRDGSTMRNVGFLRMTCTMMVGKDTMDMLEESIHLSWAICEQTEVFTDVVAHLLLE